MRYRRVRLWLSLAYAIITSLAVILWTALYLIFKLYLPLRWGAWRTRSRFERRLIEGGIPEDLARNLARKHFRPLRLTSILRWWRFLEWRSGGNSRREVEEPSREDREA